MTYAQTLHDRLHADDCLHPHDPEKKGLRERLQEQIAAEILEREDHVYDIASADKEGQDILSKILGLALASKPVPPTLIQQLRIATLDAVNDEAWRRAKEK